MTWTYLDDFGLPYEDGLVRGAEVVKERDARFVPCDEAPQTYTRVNFSGGVLNTSPGNSGGVAYKHVLNPDGTVTVTFVAVVSCSGGLLVDLEKDAFVRWLREIPKRNLRGQPAYLFSPWLS